MRGKSSEAKSGSGFVAFLWQNKAWWLTPIVIVLLLLVALVWVSAPGSAPFMYTVF